MRRLLSTAHRALSLVENLCSLLAVVIMAAIMLIVTADVALRYLWNSPLGWSYDVIDLYLSVFLFYLMLSAAFRRHGHIRVDIVQQYLGLRMRAALEVVTSVAALGVFVPITVLGAARCWSQYGSGDVIQGEVDWPTWLSSAAVPLGAGLFSLRLLLTALAQAVTLASGDVIVSLPPLHGEKLDQPALGAE